MNDRELDIVVIGGGVAGVTAAYTLARRHRVTLLERNDYLGGHTNTRTVSDPLNPALPIDTGFIVCNPRNYPNFYRFLGQLGVQLQSSDMSFGFSCERTGLQYMGPSLREFLRAPGNLLNPQFLAMLVEQFRFNRRALKDFQSGALRDIALGEYLHSLGTSDFFFENYLAPLIGSIWSAPDSNAREFPAATFITFFNNHGMLELRTRPQWQTVVGGSHSYLKAFRSVFRGNIRTECPARSVRRVNGGVELLLSDGSRERYDVVVLATHADEALALLEDPTAQEQSALSAWRYSRNRTVLHTDASVLGPRRRLWAAWNYRRRRGAQSDSPVAITYYMNRLQNLRAQNDYFVTLNCTDQIDAAKILYEVEYTHPVYTVDAPRSQAAVRELQGAQNTYFCGAYLRYGFHEDAVVSALDVARRFSVDL